jgi:hypothetical protein
MHRERPILEWLRDIIGGIILFALLYAGAVLLMCLGG